jgi:ribonucleotide monophosphatase NagD (HAD superfamily)
MAGARAAGLDGALVLTGASTAAMARDAEPAPAFVAATLAELLLAP